MIDTRVLYQMLDIFIACVLGGVIGFERERHGRAAGLRTHILVSAGAAVFTIISIDLPLLVPSFVHQYTQNIDPGRIAAQIVTGIGFLGAGAIIKEGFTIRGLTTAASLWVVAAIGMAAGAGAHLIAIFSTVISLAILVFLNFVEKIYPRDFYKILTVRAPNEADISDIIDAIKRNKVKILFFNYERDYDSSVLTIEIGIRIFEKRLSDKFAQQIVESLEKSAIPLKSIKWSNF